MTLPTSKEPFLFWPQPVLKVEFQSCYLYTSFSCWKQIFSANVHILFVKSWSFPRRILPPFSFENFKLLNAFLKSRFVWFGFSYFSNARLHHVEWLNFHQKQSCLTTLDLEVLKHFWIFGHNIFSFVLNAKECISYRCLLIRLFRINLWNWCRAALTRCLGVINCPPMSFDFLPFYCFYSSFDKQFPFLFPHPRGVEYKSWVVGHLDSFIGRCTNFVQEVATKLLQPAITDLPTARVWPRSALSSKMEWTVLAFQHFHQFSWECPDFVLILQAEIFN